MKWNAIITKSQYEKALRRKTELANALPGSPEEDEMTLILILVKDYENRQMEMAEATRAENSAGRITCFGFL